MGGGATISGDVPSKRIEFVLKGRCSGVRALVGLTCSSAQHTCKVARKPTGGHLPETGKFSLFFQSRDAICYLFRSPSHEEEELQFLVPGVCANVRVATAEYPHQHVCGERVFMP